MSTVRTTIGFVAASLLLAAFATRLAAADPGAPTGPANGAHPPIPALRSPVKSFRELLAMSPVEREQQLASRRPEVRPVIAAKLHEYEELPSGERELRLRTTELSWYLKQLMALSPPQRALMLAEVPSADREVVEARLIYWDKIPAQQQQRLLESEAVLKYLAGIPGGSAAAAGSTNQIVAEDLDRFRHLSPGERRKVMDQFKRLFELDNSERAVVLERRPGPEREQLDRALVRLRQIPADKQPAYVDAVNRFAVMSPEEQRKFLKSAERWKRLTSEERSAWQALFSQSPPLPELPPLPPGFDPYAPPPLPPNLPPDRSRMQATNATP